MTFLHRLQMFRKFDMFRILICGGDGSVGWVLSEMDRLNLSSKVRDSHLFVYFD